MAKSSLKNLRGSDVFLPQTDGEISGSLVQSWTQQAAECYSINCDCKKCSIDRTKYSFVCQMPKVINELLKNKIKPALKQEFIQT